MHCVRHLKYPRVPARRPIHTMGKGSAAAQHIRPVPFLSPARMARDEAERGGLRNDNACTAQMKVPGRRRDQPADSAGRERSFQWIGTDTSFLPKDRVALTGR